ncbi:MAG: ABC transporter substrate-binding protein [Rhodoferax sp.]|nr:ABC transporter substrate-binding protein [Rhodoferax sp.]
MAGPVLAQDLKLAMSSPPSSMDPHFQNITTNANVVEHMFEPLVMRSAAGKLAPGLAESWTLIDNLTWEFKIRRGARFSDGSPVTAEDVVYSLDRPANIKNSPASFTQYTKAISAKKVVDAGTVRLTTAVPTPLLPDDLVQVIIVSKKATEGLASDDFASGRGMVGSGPYKFVRFLRDDRVEMARNEHYNGPNKTPWATTTIRFIANPSTRLAALLAGDVQAIENVPTPDLARVRADANLRLVTATSQRMVFMFADWRDKSPFVTDKSGAVLATNPLKDVRVRRALSMAINRDAIRDRVMEGLSETTENLVLPGTPGYVDSLMPVKFDPDGARKLLGEAGYPNGFGLTLHGPNNRLINDEKIAQTVAQMFTRVGVDTKVETMPMAVYAPRGAKYEFSVALIAWGNSVDLSSPIRALIACENPAKGMGVVNWAKYCNPKLDELLLKADNMDPLVRARILREAAGIISRDVALIPLHFQVSTWAVRKGLTYQGRGDERTYAFNIKPQ